MPKQVDGLDGNRIESLVTRVERLLEEKKALDSDVKDIWEEGKNAGFNVKMLKRLVAYRKQDREKVRMEDAEFEPYKAAVGMD